MPFYEFKEQQLVIEAPDEEYARSLGDTFYDDGGDNYSAFMFELDKSPAIEHETLPAGYLTTAWEEHFQFARVDGRGRARARGAF